MMTEAAASQRTAAAPAKAPGAARISLSQCLPCFGSAPRRSSDDWCANSNHDQHQIERLVVSLEDESEGRRCTGCELTHGRERERGREEWSNDCVLFRDETEREAREKKTGYEPFNLDEK